MHATIASSSTAAQNETCVENLRHLGTAFAEYAYDNNQCLPPYPNNRMFLHEKVYVFGTSGTKLIGHYPARADLLIAALMPYTHSTAFWHCPADPLVSCTVPLNSIMGPIAVDHKSSSYVTDWKIGWIGYPATINGLDAVGRDGVQRHFGPTTGLLAEEAIYAQPPQNALSRMLDRVRQPKMKVLNSHGGHVNELLLNGSVHANALP